MPKFLLAAALSFISIINVVQAQSTDSSSRYVEMLNRCRHPGWTQSPEKSGKQQALWTRQENNCLKQYIDEQLALLFDNEDYLSQARQELNTLQNSYNRLYTLVYNNNASCHQQQDFYSCGDANANISEILWNQELKAMLNNLLRYQDSLNFSNR